MRRGQLWKLLQKPATGRRGLGQGVGSEGELKRNSGSSVPALGLLGGCGVRGEAQLGTLRCLQGQVWRWLWDTRF